MALNSGLCHVVIIVLSMFFLVTLRRRYHQGQAKTGVETKTTIPPRKQRLETVHIKPGPQLLAVSQNEERHGDKGCGDEAKKGVSPAKSQSVVHFQAAQRQDGTGNGPDDGVGRQGRGRVHVVRVDQVHGDGDEAEDVAFFFRRKSSVNMQSTALK